MQEEPRKGFIEEVQELGEGTKRKILFVATGVAMIAVVYLWLGYFNGLVAGIAQTPFAENAQVQPAVQGGASSSTGQAAQIPQTAVAAQNAPQTQGPGFFAKVGIGMAYVYGEFTGFFGGIASALEGPRQYIIKPN